MTQGAAWQPPAWLAPLQAALPGLGSPGSSAVDRLGAVVQDYLSLYQLDQLALRPGYHHDLGWVSSGAGQLAVHRFWRPDAYGNLLLVHGYYDHSGLYPHLIRYGLARGCNVLVFDLPGHGLSSGARAVIADFGLYRQALSDVRRASCLPDLPWWVVGQSTGGSAVLDDLMHGEDDWHGAILLAPLVRIRHWHRVCLVHTLLRPFVSRIDRKFTRNSGDEDFLRRHREDPLRHLWVEVAWLDALRRWLRDLPRGPVRAAPPLLVIQGTADATVDWRYNLRRIAQWFPAHQRLLLAGARHHLANETAQLRADYLAVVDRFLGLGTDEEVTHAVEEHLHRDDDEDHPH